MQVAGGGGAFLAAAQQGMFAVDTESAGQLMMSISQMQARLNQRLSRIFLLKMQAKLGDLVEAHAIAARNTQVASEGEQSLEFVLKRFREALQDAHQALEVGMRNYAELEAQTEEEFRWRIGHG